MPDDMNTLEAEAVERESITREFPVEFSEVGDGRTIEARIVPFNTPTVVRDKGGEPYTETWLPGAFENQTRAAEMRGGTANCTVVIADHGIGSPLVKNPPLAIALNLPSFDKYEETLAPGGTLIVNQSTVDRAAKRTDIHTIFVPCNEIAEEIGDRKLMNMVAIGALLTVLPEISLKDVEKALEGHLPARHKHLLPKNYEALKRGFEHAQKEWDKVPA